jgi:biotin transport system substrate-specific component
MTIAIPRLDRTTAADRGLTLADFLVPIPVGERLNSRVRHILLIATGALFIYMTARLAIPRDPVPWTGQTFGILVVGGALGARRGFASVALYVLLGLVGLPFFAEGKGGTAVLLGPTGGYLIGFLLAGTVVGRLAELGWDRRIGGALAMMLIGTFVIYAFGLPWLSYSRHLSTADTLAGGLVPFIAWDAAKLVIAAGIFPIAWWLIGRRPEDR